jgi:molybdate transport system permease protein
LNLLTGDDAGAIALSLRVAATAVAGELPLAVLAAYTLSRSRLAARVVLETAVTLPLVLPPGAPRDKQLNHAGIVLAFRWSGAALAAAVMAFPLMVRPMRLAMEAIEPEVGEAALTLGAPPLVRFFQLTLPLAAPGVAAGVVLGFAKALGEFGATITFVGAIPGETLTLPTAIYQSTQTPGAEGRTIALCLISTTLAVGAVLVSELIGRAFLKRTRPTS